jgi:hypothetical protein
MQQAWTTYKQLALAPDGRVRRGAAGDGATSDAQAAALLHAVWLRDRTAFDAIWGWTREALSRRQAHPANPKRDGLFAGRWAGGEVTDWSNSTAADQRLAAALLLASRLWNEPRYEREAKLILEAVLEHAAFSWHNLSIAAANSFLKDLEPVTTSAGSLTPAYYRMFAEGSRNAIWLQMLDGTYDALARASAAAGPLGGGAGLLPTWFSVARRNGEVGPPVDPAWQSSGFAGTGGGPALVAQLALDLRWANDPRARALLGPTARILAQDLAQRGRIAAGYARSGAGASAETDSYGALAGIALFDPRAEGTLRAQLDAALAGRDPDGLLDAMEGMWMLAGGPPNYWRIWWPPEDLPTTRNDAVTPPDSGWPWRYFEETGHVVQGEFLEHFTRHGGVEVFGLPRTDEVVEDGRTVQYFQRGRLEAGPGSAGGVSVAALGRRAAAARGVGSRPEAQAVPAFESDEARLYVPETGHSVSGGFRRFYERHGSAVLGSPITEELSEDGFTVQYFERMVLEYLPGKPVQATLLGDDLLREKGWLR